MSLGVVPRVQLALNTAAPGADTDIPGAEVTVRDTGSRIRVVCAFQNATTLKAEILRDGTTVTLLLNSNVALVAEGIYAFDLPNSIAGDVINWQIGTDGIVRMFNVFEMTGNAS